MGGLRPPIAPLRGDSQKPLAPRAVVAVRALWLLWQAAQRPRCLALWLGLKICGCAQQAPQKPRCLALWLGVKALWLLWQAAQRARCLALWLGLKPRERILDR